MSQGSVIVRAVCLIALAGVASARAAADDAVFARYVVAAQAAVAQHWNRPDAAAPGLSCVLQVEQIPGGDVIKVKTGSPCNADPATRTSIEQAVVKASPLPYQGYENVFQRTIQFNFRYDGQGR